MTNTRPPVTGRDVAGAGALLLAVNALAVGIGLGIGELLGIPEALGVVGLLVGFLAGIWVVARRFHDV